MFPHPPVSKSTSPTSRMRTVGPSAARQVGHDPIVWLLAVVMVGLGLGYVLPGLDPEAVFQFGEYYGLPVLLLATILAVLAGVRGLRDEAERRFWYLLAVGLGLNLAVRIVYLLPLPSPQRGRLLVDVFYVLFYFCFIRALRVRPDRGGASATGPLAWVETLATAVFLTGLLVYFVLVPRSLNPEGYGTWAPSLLLYWVLDGYLFLTLVHLHRSSTSERWRVIYAWLGIAAMIWVVTDLYDVFYYLGRVAWIDDVSPWSWVWNIPYALIGLAARVRVTPWPTGLAQIGVHPDPHASRNGTVGVVVLYALVLPVLHFASNLLALLNPVTRSARELTVLVFLPPLLGIAFWHQRLLERRAQRLELAGREVEEQRALLAAAVEQTKDPVLVSDAGGRVAYANAAWEQTTGSSRQALLEQHAEEVVKYFGPRAVDILRAGRNGGTASERISRTTPDGEQKEEILSVSPVLDGEGRLTHLTVSVRDVTHETTLERRLQQAARMEALGTLAGGIAHDFNNMLAAILGYSELLLDEAGANPEARLDIEEIVKAAERAKSLTSQILTFSRQELAERRPVHLGSVVQDALGFLRPTVPSSIEIHQDIDPDFGPIEAETGRIHQVVMNLVANAAQAVGEKGSIGVAVTEETADGRHDAALMPPELPPGNYAVLSVTDDGQGMDVKTLERMYDPFFTTKELGHGTGLGLSVVHGIVASHGGGIAVESEPGVGTRFRVCFPLIDAHPDSTTGAGKPAAGPSGGASHILLVDDEAMVADALSRGLDRAGFHVTVATDPEEALRVFLAAPRAYQLLITDQTMPGLTGLELAAGVHRVRPCLPVLLMTGYSESVTRERVEEAGVKGVVYKPVNRADLVEAIRGVLVGCGRGGRQPSPVRP